MNKSQFELDYLQFDAAGHAGFFGLVILIFSSFRDNFIVAYALTALVSVVAIKFFIERCQTKRSKAIWAFVYLVPITILLLLLDARLVHNAIPSVLLVAYAIIAAFGFEIFARKLGIHSKHRDNK